MSLGKLLATGRSLVSGPSLGRYDISSRNRLPKFGSARNPFAQPAQPAQPAPSVGDATPVAPGQPAVAAEPMPAVAPETQPKKTQVIEYKKTQRIAAMADLRAKTDWALKFKQWTDALRAFCLVLWAWVVALFKKGSGLLPRRFRRPEPKPVFPRFGKPAVQTELSLDNVKVVRNDLEESDLEIVTAETATSTQVAPQAAAASSKRGPVPPALKKLTDRLLGVKAT
jgi:hypothetical protein